MEIRIEWSMFGRCRLVSMASSTARVSHCCRQIFQSPPCRCRRRPSLTRRICSRTPMNEPRPDYSMASITRSMRIATTFTTLSAFSGQRRLAHRRRSSRYNCCASPYSIAISILQSVSMKVKICFELFNIYHCMGLIKNRKSISLCFGRFERDCNFEFANYLGCVAWFGDVCAARHMVTSQSEAERCRHAATERDFKRSVDDSRRATIRLAWFAHRLC